MKDRDLLWQLLAKKSDNELSDSESERQDKVLDNSPQFRKVLKRLSEVFRCLESNSQPESLKAFDNLCRKLAAQHRISASHFNSPDKNSSNSFSKN